MLTRLLGVIATVYSSVSFTTYTSITATSTTSVVATTTTTTTTTGKSFSRSTTKTLSSPCKLTSLLRTAATVTATATPTYTPPPYCNNPGSYCDTTNHPDDSCYCFANADGGNTCAETYGACGSACDTSADCGSGFACLSTAATDCGYNSCTEATDTTCLNNGGMKRLFRIRGRRDEEVRYRSPVPPSDS